MARRCSRITYMSFLPASISRPSTGTFAYFQFLRHRARVVCDARARQQPTATQLYRFDGGEFVLTERSEVYMAKASQVSGGEEVQFSETSYPGWHELKNATRGDKASYIQCSETIKHCRSVL